MVLLEIERLCLMCKGRGETLRRDISACSGVKTKWIECSSCRGVGWKKSTVRVRSYKEVKEGTKVKNEKLPKCHHRREAERIQREGKSLAFEFDDDGVVKTVLRKRVKQEKKRGA